MATSTNTSAETGKGRRVTIDLTPAATSEVDRLRGITGLTTADIFRHAISMFRIYVDARSNGEELRIIDPSKPTLQTRVELPIEIRQQVQR